MKYRTTKSGFIAVFLLFLLGTGCAPVKTIWTSEPEVGTSAGSFL